jgi:dTDP-4-amino-4,6-dideoxygalactose transaminase
MLKVLHLLPRVPLGRDAGETPPAELLELARALAGEGVRSDIMVGESADAGDAPAAGGHADVTVMRYRWTRPLDTAADADGSDRLAAELAAWLQDLLSLAGDYDVIHAHDLLFASQLARMARSLAGTPYLTTASFGITDECLPPGCDPGAAVITADPAAAWVTALPPGTPVLAAGCGTAARYRELYEAVARGHALPEWRDPLDPIPMARPDITGAEVRAAASALVSGKLSQGPEVGCFEQEFAQWHGRPHAVAVNSAASALYAVLVCAGIRGEVLVPSFTWATTANVVVAAGATPVWVDIDDDTLGMSPEAAAAAISPRTEAVLCVHFAGHPCRVAELAQLCSQHRLLLVEDAAEAAGARQNGALTGTFGVGCYSFYGTKNMTTGEGGMVLTGDADLAARIRTFRGHGMRVVPGSPYPWRKEAVEAGFNFRMPEPLAAIGRQQLARLAGMNARRHAIAEQFDAALADLHDQVTPHRELPGFLHAYHMYVVRVRDESIRDEVVTTLRLQGVDASVHFHPPVHEHSFYQGKYRAVPADLPITGHVARSVVTLPLYTTMSRQSVDRVTSSLADVLAKPAER